jgi:1-deoxy-D-xylulose-5-phosphate synthase
MEQTLLSTLSSPADLKALAVDQLPSLAGEIREAICAQVMQSGGHLAPNLGVVELTIALHYVFDFGHDRLLFDVGHQCYPHKLLTGRLHMLGRLRQRDGMAGFPEPRESPFDLFSVGHAGTSISTAVGMARGDVLNGEGVSEANPDGRHVVALIGDASIVNGVAMEGLNNAGTLKRQLLVVLNDNGMSIAKPQGAVSGYFDRLRVSDTYRNMKRAAKGALQRLPGGDALKDLGHRMGEMAKDALLESTWFEHFGLVTIGPVDGHDIPTLIEMLAAVKDVDRPLVLHVHTTKGKGFDFAEGDATTFHSPKPFTVTGCGVELKSGGRSFTTAFGNALCDMMAGDERIVACSAAMPDGTGITQALDLFPARTFDTGICESHAMDMMAGMAKTGLRPFFAVYSTFLQRAFDQAFQEVTLQGLPVRLCLDRAGLVGGDGAVHHGFCDIALMRALPGTTVCAAMDEPSLRAALEFMRTWNDGLSCVRYPRDDVDSRLAGTTCPPFQRGVGRCLLRCDSPDVILLSYGVMAITALEAADALADEVNVDVWDARFAKPVDRKMLIAALERDVPVLTLEDHSIVGGFGAACLEEASALGLNASKLQRLGLPDRWIYQGSRAQQLAEAGLDVDAVVVAIRAASPRACSKDTDKRATTATTSATS